MSAGRRVAVLGAGVMGACVALFLARRGFEVTLFDQADRPLDRASRWNEGKIHLGYLYGADATLETARRVIPGGLAFAPLVAELTGADVRAQSTPEADHYLVHRDSVTDAATLAARFAAIDALVRDHPGADRYLIDVSGAASDRLAGRELESFADTALVAAGFRVPERSVNTQWVADRLCEALEATPRIGFRGGERIVSARPRDAVEGRWTVGPAGGGAEDFDIVVNALWNGLVGVDLTAGLPPEHEWSNRFRLALFVRSAAPLALRSAVVSVGPFGDVKNYNDRDFYLSWYPAGLVQESEAVDPAEPPALSPDDEAALVSAVRRGLGAILPGIEQVIAGAETVRCAGGFVFAQGRGSLGDPGSSLHRRDRFGVRRRGNYFSVDTGKYSTAPWLADRLARQIDGA